MNEDLVRTIDSLSGLYGLGDIDGNDAIFGAVVDDMIAKKQVAANAGTKLKKLSAITARGKALASTFSPAQRYFISQTPKLNQQTKIDISDRNNKWEDTHLYRAVRIQPAGGGQTDILKPDDRIITGICNMANRKVPMGVAAVIDSVKFSYGFKGAAMTTANPDFQPGEVVYTNSMDAETGGSSPLAIPVGILNGELELRVNATRIFKVPVRAFMRDGFSVAIAVEGKNDSYELKNKLLIQQGDDIQFVLWQAEGQTFTSDATNNHFVRVDIHCVGVSARS